MTLSGDEQILQALADIPSTESLVGVFVSQVGAIATVDTGGVRLQVKSSTQVPCRAGDAVRLEWRNDDLVMLGPAVARAVVGRITAAGNPATVEYPNGSGVTAALPVMNNITLASGDLVFIDWGSGGLIVGRINVPYVPPPPPPPVPPTTVTRTERFDANDSGAYQSGYGWRTNEIWSSASNSGGWFYGSKIRDTIPDGAVIESASINLPLIEQLGAAPFGRHDYEGKPGGALTIHAASTLGGKSGEVGIPTSLIDHLKANPGGLGYSYGGKNRWRGTKADGSSGRLTVTYTYTL